MIEFLKSLFGGRKSEEGESSPEQVRRWDAAKTTRLNESHWARVTGSRINEDLASYLVMLRTRATFEAANNPYVDGVIKTHATDLVGKNGPSLQVLSEDGKYNKALETIWRVWWRSPDINGKLSGPAKMRLWIRYWWTCGEFLEQKVIDRSAKGPVKLRLLSLDPRRLQTPLSKLSDPNIVLGVKLTKTGKPITYYITQEPQNSLHPSANLDPKAISARNIVHWFETIEAGQARGVPVLSTVLQTVADIRDYDDEVLDAAREAADWAVYLFTKHPDAPFMKVNESEKIERRTVSTLPPGWEPQQVQAQQPSTKYVEFRKERHGDLGRPAGMPAMIVRGDSSNHNYSSARFDGQVYQRANGAIQGLLETGVMDGLVADVEREAILAKALGNRPADVHYQWTWPVPPHVDPSREAKAQETRLKNKTLSLTLAAAADGLDFEELVEQVEKEVEIFHSKGWVHPFEAVESGKGGMEDKGNGNGVVDIDELLDAINDLKGSLSDAED